MEHAAGLGVKLINAAIGVSQRGGHKEGSYRELLHRRLLGLGVQEGASAAGHALRARLAGIRAAAV
jgi:hypothetical protein